MSSKNKKNKKLNFWDEICGTIAFQELGLTSVTHENLKIFDEWYFKFYPYLNKYLPKGLIKNKNVLEIGLGFGSVGNFIFKQSKTYTGVDLAKNPVDLMNKRIDFESVNTASAQEGSVLDLKFDDNTFDTVVSIGCIHHTGSIPKAIDEITRVLKPGGTMIIMVYARYSLTYFLYPFLFVVDLIKNGMDFQKIKNFRNYLYDSNISGEGAPLTHFSTKKELYRLLSRTKSMKISRENYQFPRIRKKGYLINSYLIKLLGCDFYIIAKK